MEHSRSGSTPGTAAKASGRKGDSAWKPPEPLAPAILQPPAPATTLSKAETEEFAACESDIAALLGAWVTAGEALDKIHSKKLYRDRYDSFENYTQDRWGFGFAQAHRLMAGAKVMARLSPIGDGQKLPLPDCEAQVRPLTSVPEAKVVKVWKEVVAEGGGRVTAKLVSRVAKPYQQKTKPGCPKVVIDVATKEVTPAATPRRAITALQEALVQLRAAAKSGLTGKDKAELKAIGAKLTALIVRITG